MKCKQNNVHLILKSQMELHLMIVHVYNFVKRLNL